MNQNLICFQTSNPLSGPHLVQLKSFTCCPLTISTTPSLKPTHSISFSTRCSLTKINPLPSPPQRYYDFSQHKVEAIRITHCRILTEDLADLVYNEVKSKRKSLADMAVLLSTCQLTRNQNGDTGWISTTSLEHSDFISPELSEIIISARPQALTKVRVSYGWEVFIVEDVRHAFVPSFFGRTRRNGHSIAPNMRKRSQKKPVIDPKSYYLRTFGCQMNMSDSERMCAELESVGYHSTNDPNHSALYILNTCALREHAEEKVYSYLGEQAQRKWDAPDEITLVVTGCVAQQEGEKLLRRVPEVDIVMGPQYANRINDVIHEFETNLTQVVAIEPIHIQEDLTKPKRGSKLTAWVNIIYGCLERCTYCVVPNTRGLEQSRSMEGIKREIEGLAKEGFKEVILLGQNVDAYGRDLAPRRTLSDLLRYIHDVEGIERIRFTTGHPRYISDNLVNTVAELPKVMEHFHIPPQAGDDGVLKAMRRGYTSSRYLHIVNKIRNRIPDASICADMIVGFPGETDEAFENTVQLADQVVFDANMVRAYSPRPNTPAAKRDNQVSEEVKSERLAIMNRKMRDHALERSRRYLERTVEVLVEGPNAKNEKEVCGRERTNRMVFFEGRQELIGKIVEVDIHEVFAFSLRGRLVRVLR